MPLKALVDLESFDRSRILHTRADLYSLLPQRGTFALIDAVVRMEPDEDVIVGYRDVRADEWWCKDHVPGKPVFPGALMVEACAQLGTYHFYHRVPEQGGSFIGFTGIDRTTFRATVEPGCRLFLVAKVHRTRSIMFTYVAQGVVERDGVLDPGPVFQTEVTGMVLVPAEEQRKGRAAERV